MGDFWETFGWAAVLGFVVGMVLGGVVGYFSYLDASKDFNEKIDIENQCIAGNVNACRIYEVRYGR